MVTTPRMKTITLHFDYETWKKYNDVKTNLGMTWGDVASDWFEREERGDFK